MKYFNKLILCAAVVTAFGANAATYNVKVKRHRLL